VRVEEYTPCRFLVRCAEQTMGEKRTWKQRNFTSIGCKQIVMAVGRQEARLLTDPSQTKPNRIKATLPGKTKPKPNNPYPEIKQRGLIISKTELLYNVLSSNFLIHVSVSDLYIPRIGLHILLQPNRQTAGDI
jgi:hypothetical protein